MDRSFLCRASDLSKYSGHYLAGDIRDPLSGILLIRKNSPITDKLLSTLPGWDIGALYISQDLIEDEEVPVDERTRALAHAQKTKVALNNVFGDVLESVGQYHTGYTHVIDYQSA